MSIAGLVKRLVKGAPLTAAEHDANLTAIEGAIEAVELTPGPAGPKGDPGDVGPAGAPGTTTWAGITDKPSTFAPSAHASSHATGGSDAIANVPATASQLTADANDLALPTGDVIDISSNAARNVTGIVAAAAGTGILLVNTGGHAITLKHESASSADANRITVPWAGDYVLSANGGAAVLVYFSGTSRWRVI